MVRSIASVAVLLLLGSFSFRAQAAEALLRNDTLPTDGGALQVRSGVVFSDYQGAVTVLSGPTAQSPATLTAIDVLYVPQNGGAVQDPWDLDIWNVPDAGVAAVSSHGDLFSTSTLTTSVGLATSTTAFNRFTLPTPLQLNR